MSTTITPTTNHSTNAISAQKTKPRTCCCSKPNNNLTESPKNQTLTFTAVTSNTAQASNCIPTVKPNNPVATVGIKPQGANAMLACCTARTVDEILAAFTGVGGHSGGLPTTAAQGAALAGIGVLSIMGVIASKKIIDLSEEQIQKLNTALKNLEKICQITEDLVKKIPNKDSEEYKNLAQSLQQLKAYQTYIKQQLTLIVREKYLAGYVSGTAAGGIGLAQMFGQLLPPVLFGAALHDFVRAGLNIKEALHSKKQLKQSQTIARQYETVDSIENTHMREALSIQQNYFKKKGKEQIYNALAWGWAGCGATTMGVLSLPLLSAPLATTIVAPPAMPFVAVGVLTVAIGTTLYFNNRLTSPKFMPGVTKMEFNQIHQLLRQMQDVLQKINTQNNEGDSSENSTKQTEHIQKTQDCLNGLPKNSAFAHKILEENRQHSISQQYLNTLQQHASSSQTVSYSLKRNLNRGLLFGSLGLAVKQVFSNKFNNKRHLIEQIHQNERNNLKSLANTLQASRNQYLFELVQNETINNQQKQQKQQIDTIDNAHELLTTLKDETNEQPALARIARIQSSSNKILLRYLTQEKHTRKLNPEFKALFNAKNYYASFKQWRQHTTLQQIISNTHAAIKNYMSNYLTQFGKIYNQPATSKFKAAKPMKQIWRYTKAICSPVTDLLNTLGKSKFLQTAMFNKTTDIVFKKQYTALFDANKLTDAQEMLKTAFYEGACCNGQAYLYEDLNDLLIDNIEGNNEHAKETLKRLANQSIDQYLAYQLSKDSRREIAITAEQWSALQTLSLNSKEHNSRQLA